jgi:hypothetical protein
MGSRVKRPSFQFYPADWRKDANLRRCSPAARGAWMDVLCVLHDAEPYGIVDWPLKELASAACVSLANIKELADKRVLKGCDSGRCDALIYTPRHGRKLGPPVTLIQERNGPIWYSARFVRDEYLRSVRGSDTRFGDGNGEAPKPTPKAAPNPPFGDGATSSPSSATTVEKKKRDKRAAVPVETVTAETLIAFGFDGGTAAEFIAHKSRLKAPLTQRAWHDHCAEAAKVGWSPLQAAEKVMAKGWKGFESKYVAGESRGTVVPINRQEAIEQRNRAVGEEWLRQEEAKDAAR